MKLNSIALCAVSAVAGLFLGRDVLAQGKVYEAQIIARSGDVFGNRVAEAFRCPDINNRGQTVFEAATSLGEIIVASNGIQVFSRDTIDGIRLITMNSAQITDSGDVYFSVAYEDELQRQRSGFFRHDAAIALRGDVIGGYTIASSPSGYLPVNNLGEVAFTALFSGVPGSAGNTELAATQNRIIAQRGAVVDGAEIGSIWDVTINDHGDTVFFAASPDIGEGIFTEDELLVAPGMTVDGRLLTGVFRARLNNRQDLAMTAEYFGGTSVFVNGEEVAATGQVIDGRLITDIQTHIAPQLNRRGETAFIAYYNGGFGIFTPTQSILESGDTIDGIRVDGMCEPSMNDRGQIITAFGERNSANMYVVVFTPVPEPGSISMLAAAGIMATTCAWRQRRKRY